MHKNVTMSRLRRYYHPTVDKVLEKFGRPAVSTEPGARQAASRALPNSAFHCQSGKRSIPAEELDQIVAKRKKWSSFSPQSQHTIPAAWAVMLACSEQDSRVPAAVAWKALLFQAPSVIQHIQSKRMSLVIESSQFAVLAWPVAPTQRGEVFEIDCIGRPELLVIESEADYDVFPFQAAPPIKQLKGPKSAPSGVVLAKVGNPVSVLEFAARKAFRGLSDVFVWKVMHLKGLLPMAKDKIPGTTMGRVCMLVKACLPGLTQKELDEIMMLRSPKVQPESLLCEVSSGGACDGVLDPSDGKEIHRFRKLAADHKEEIAIHKAKVGSKFLDKPSPLMKMIIPKAKPKDAVIVGPRRPFVLCPSLARLKATLPVVAGCTVQKIARSNKYTVYYPGVVPASRSRTFGAAMPEASVQKHIVKWAWQHHSLKTGTVCPWDL